MATCRHETENTFFNPYRLYAHPSNSIIFVIHTVEVIRVRTVSPCLRRPVPIRTALIHEMEHHSMICSTFELKRVFPKWLKHSRGQRLFLNIEMHARSLPNRVYKCLRMRMLELMPSVDLISVIT